MSTPETLRWWAEQFRTRTSEFYTSHVLAADLTYGADEIEKLQVENAKLRELLHDLHMAYVGALNKAEGMDAGLIWEHCEMVDAELAKSHERYEADRRRFDAAMRDLGIEASQ